MSTAKWQNIAGSKKFFSLKREKLKSNNLLVLVFSTYQASGNKILTKALLNGLGKKWSKYVGYFLLCFYKKLTYLLARPFIRNLVNQTCDIIFC